jgi:hypothetical protein
MPTIYSYNRQLDAERLKALCDARDRAVAAVQQEVDRQQGKRRTAAPGKCYSYPTNYSVSQSPKGITLAARDAELKKIRQQFELEKLTRQMALVMSDWRDP